MVVATIFICKLCGTELTDFLKQMDESKFPRPWAMNCQTVPVGSFLRAKSDWTARELSGHIYGHKEQGDVILVKCGDYLVHGVEATMRKGAKFGCCGYTPDGSEINANCKNGHPIGTIIDECSTPHLNRLADNAVELVSMEVNEHE